MFPTNLDYGNTKNGVTCDSIKCSVPERGLAEICSSVGLGHNSADKNLNTSFIALLKNQVSSSESETQSFVERWIPCSG